MPRAACSSSTSSKPQRLEQCSSSRTRCRWWWATPHRRRTSSSSSTPTWLAQTWGAWAWAWRLHSTTWITRRCVICRPLREGGREGGREGAALGFRVFSAAVPDRSPYAAAVEAAAPLALFVPPPPSPSPSHVVQQFALYQQQVAMGGYAQMGYLGGGAGTPILDAAQAQQQQQQAAATASFMAAAAAAVGTPFPMGALLNSCMPGSGNSSGGHDGPNPRNDRHFWKEEEQQELLRLVADQAYRQSMLGALAAGLLCLCRPCLQTHLPTPLCHPCLCRPCLQTHLPTPLCHPCCPPATRPPPPHLTAPHRAAPRCCCCRRRRAQLGRHRQAPGARQALGAAQVRQPQGQPGAGAPG